MPTEDAEARGTSDPSKGAQAQGASDPAKDAQARSASDPTADAQAQGASRPAKDAQAPGAPLDLAAARASIRETAKWVMAASAAVATLVLGSTTISSLGSLDLGPRLGLALVSAAVAAACCWLLFSAAVNVLSQRIYFLHDIATSADFAAVRTAVDKSIRVQYPAGINSVATLSASYDALRNQYFTATTQDIRDRIKRELDPRRQRVGETTELCVTEQLVQRFDALMTKLRTIGPLAVVALICLVWAANPRKPDDVAAFAKPVSVSVAWDGQQEEAIVAAGLSKACMAAGHPSLIATEKGAGLRTYLIAVPQHITADCGVVKVVLDSSGRLAKTD